MLSGPGQSMPAPSARACHPAAPSARACHPARLVAGLLEQNTSRRKTPRGTALAVVLLSTCGAAAPRTEDPSAAERFAARLDRVDQRAGAIRDLTADFVEKKSTSLLKEPLVSRGRVLVKGSQTRWETKSPHVSILSTDESRIAIYFPSRSTVEVYPVDRRLRSLIVSPLPQLARLRRHFKLQPLPEPAGRTSDSPEGTLGLRLMPKDESLKEIIEEVQVRIDESLGLAVRVVLIDPDHDHTVIAFSNIRTNVGLTDRDVELNAPPDATVVHPLGPSVDTRPRSTRPDRP
ncbi:MAG: outer membrane lipoprotein carrier protein LolA [Phycisphaerae bacterium]